MEVHKCICCGRRGEKSPCDVCKREKVVARGGWPVEGLQYPYGETPREVLVARMGEKLADFVETLAWYDEWENHVVDSSEVSHSVASAWANRGMLARRLRIEQLASVGIVEA